MIRHGHVFLVHGDLRKLSCDAWLVPGGSAPRPGTAWLDSVAPQPAEGIPANWEDIPNRVLHWEPKQAGWPRPWVVCAINRSDAPAEKFVAAANHFLSVATKAVISPRWGRALPLVALPLVGAGRAGGAWKAGEIVRSLLRVLYEFTRHNRVDVALVMKDPAQYAAAQVVRSEFEKETAWPELTTEHQQKIDELAERAICQELVLFLGAGVSQSAGLPSWSSLLQKLAAGELGNNPYFRNLGVLDQARIVQQRLPPGESLGKAVAEQVRASHYSLAHALLAALPVQEVVTTNYDVLFEMASDAIDCPVDVLPYKPTVGNRRWLLKLHGCVNQPKDIVLTREDYLRYDAGRAALAGLVQGLLITRHMLFVGFSLNDDNFHRIADAVRQAVQRQPFGTSLSVAGNPLLREMWAKDLDWLELGELPGSPRLLEICLDRLAARTVSTAGYLFDPKYNAMLSKSDRRLRDELTKLASFVNGVCPTDRRGAAWLEVEHLLNRLGLSVSAVRT